MLIKSIEKKYSEMKISMVPPCFCTSQSLTPQSCIPTFAHIHVIQSHNQKNCLMDKVPYKSSTTFFKI